MPELVKTYRELQERIGAWSAGLLAGHEQARVVTGRTSHWFYSPAYDTFAPAKFIGYEDLSLDDYDPKELDGREAQAAIKALGEYETLTDGYPEAPAIRGALGALIHGQGARLKKGAAIHVPKPDPVRNLMIGLNFSQEYYSYKLVFLRALMDCHEDPSRSVQERVWAFYHKRKAAGLVVEGEGSVVLKLNLDEFHRGGINTLLGPAVNSINNAYGTGQAVVEDGESYRFSDAMILALGQRNEEFRQYLDVRLSDYFGVFRVSCG